MINTLIFSNFDKDKSLAMEKIGIIFLAMLLLLTRVGAYAQDDRDEEKDGVRCGGTERWSEKVLTDSKASLVNYSPVNTTIDSLVHINTPTPDPNAPRIDNLELKTYKVRCNITIKKYESDNDYHLVLSDGTNTMIGEVPDPVCSEAASSAHVNQYIAGRQFVNAYIAQGNVDNVNIPEVIVTGVLFLDPPHGQTGKAPNNVELHPILDIHFSTADNIPQIPDRLLSVDIVPSVFSKSAVIKVKSSKNDLSECRFEVYAIDGSKVKEIELPVMGNSEINCTFFRDNLPAGIYIYRIINNNKLLYDGKLVIQ